MLMQNNMSRYQLVLAALKHINKHPGIQVLTQWCQNKLAEHAAYIRREGQDIPEVRS
ncbi:hypothetical protein GCM10028774_18100 [Spirosoma jeollabukense]